MAWLSIPYQEVTDFLVDLKTLLAHEVPLPQAVDTLAKDLPCRRLRDRIGQIPLRIGEGQTLGQTLGDQDLVEPFVADSLAQAERNNQLREKLTEVIAYRDAREYGQGNVPRQLRNALLYFGLVLFIFGSLMATMMTLVFPIYEEMFTDFGTELPWPTRVAMMISSKIGLVFALVVLILAVLLIREQTRGWLLSHLPGTGGLLRKLSHARLLYAMGFSLRQQPDIRVAMLHASQGVANTYLSRRLEAAASKMEKGTPSDQALQGLVPNRLRQLLALNLPAQGLAASCDRLADRLTQTLAQDIEFRSKMLNGGLTAILGLLVLFFVLSMYFPIFIMGQAI